MTTATRADRMDEHTQGNPMDQTQPLSLGDVEEGHDISKESPERMDEAQQVLQDGVQAAMSEEAQYVRDRDANQLKELEKLLGDFGGHVAQLPDIMTKHLQSFHNTMHNTLTDKVNELQHLRQQNEILELKLKAIHTLFAAGQSQTKNLLEDGAPASDASNFDEEPNVEEREQGPSAEDQEAAAEQEPVEAAVATGEPTVAAANMNESYKSQPASPTDGPSPESSTPASSDSSKSAKRARTPAASDADGQAAKAAHRED
jgi:hypothetical protein